MAAAVVTATVFFAFLFPEKLLRQEENGKCQCGKSDDLLYHGFSNW